MSTVTILAMRAGKEMVNDLCPEDLPAVLNDPTMVVWVDITGEMDDPSLYVTRDVFGFHPLAIEDCFENREHPSSRSSTGTST